MGKAAQQRGSRQFNRPVSSSRLISDPCARHARFQGHRGKLSVQQVSMKGERHGPPGPASGLRSGHHDLHEFEEAAPVGTVLEEEVEKISFTFYTWCLSLTRWVLGAKTAFSRYLAKTLRLCRDGPQSSPTALFPLPLPCFQPFATLDLDQTKEGRRSQVVDRALHVLVSALNFLYTARSFPDLELIKRQPNRVQQRALSQLRLLLEASDHGLPVHVEASGRKNLLLLTRLQELAKAADALGFSKNPYATGHTGHEVPIEKKSHSKLNPFSNLNADRLKITGQGQWNAVDYMSPEFQMSFLEPQILELDKPIYTRGMPNLSTESAEEVRKLFLKWDDLGLLVLHPMSTVHPGPEQKVKIFNAYKSDLCDRQIGDRRLKNAQEGRISGPSKDLPCGPLITRLFVPEGHGLRVCITDRSDYYHQMAVSFERSRGNLVWPPMKLKDFSGTRALQEFETRQLQKIRRIDRTVHGDFLRGIRPSQDRADPDTEVFGGFKSVLQGDHLGVEYGIDAHAGFLEQSGLLHPHGRLLTSKLIRPRGLYEGLVIDDYFTIAPVPMATLGTDDPEESAAYTAFKKAKKAYAKAGLLGSDAKDVIDSDLATVVGAEIDSRRHLVQEGLLPVGAPAAKRLSLSWIALHAASFSHTSDALHSSLVGALVSAFCFRKCSMAILNHLFKVIPPLELRPQEPKLWELPRKAAEELVLAGVLLPVLASNVKAPILTSVFSSDASMKKGAFCEAELPKSLVQALWQSGDFKGGHTFLESIPKTILKSHGGYEEGDFLEEADRDHLEEPVSRDTPDRPLAQRYDFLEICGGSGVVSDAMAKLGYVVGPIIDLSFSSHYDLTKTRTLEWILFLIQAGRVRSMALEPPCTTFSPAAHPTARSYKVPRGFNQKSKKVWIGNRLAFFCLCILWASVYAQIFALLETPRRSKMAWLDEWLRLLELNEVVETFTASCSFGSPFQKEFRFLTANMRPESICFPCTRDHVHVKIQGSLTKGSAVYCPLLAKALAQLFHDHLQAESKAFEKKNIATEGLESLLVNEIAKKAQWKVSSCWQWKGYSHINVLELASLLQVVKAAARRGGGRTCLLLDSFVALRSTCKGRSGSRALAPLLRKVLAISIAFAVYLSGLFCPTRLNPSDDPTRDAPLRASVDFPLSVDFMDLNGLYSFAALPKLRRWISNWACLALGILLLSGTVPMQLSQHSVRHRSSKLPISLHEVLQEFNPTLGFPGEGPLGGRLVLFGLLAGSTFFPSHGMLPRHKEDRARADFPSHGMLPRHKEDRARADWRLERPLEFGRPVTESTKSNREKLLRWFSDWLEEKGFCLEDLVKRASHEPELLVRQLLQYGMQLYEAGRPYSHYAETVNGLGARHPSIRRLMSGAWDLAFAWLREEPYEHHQACPYQVLLAATTLSILCGWPRVAGAIVLMWGAVCRVGEVLNATRADLVLPTDMEGALHAVMLRVGEPKTRFRAARHQVARMDWEDLVSFTIAVFDELKQQERLWPASPQLLRTRFKQLLEAMGLPTTHGPHGRPLDLGSLRAGGATHLLLATEDSELVRRRGRWLSSRTMEIYIQESSATTFYPRLPEKVKAKVSMLAKAFPEAFQKMVTLQKMKLPSQTWPHFFHNQTDWGGKKVGGGEMGAGGPERSRESRRRVKSRAADR